MKKLNLSGKTFRNQSISFTLTLLSVFIFTSTSWGQIKVMSTGKVQIGTYPNTNATLNLYSNDVPSLISDAVFSFGWGDAIKSYVNRADAIAFSVWYGGSRTVRIMGNGDFWSNTSIYSSDEKLKEKILPIENAKSMLRKLNGVSYNFIKQEDKTRRHLGFLAQDVEKIFPNIVYQTDSGVKGIAYVELIPVIIEALKEQAEEIDALKVENTNLKSAAKEKSATIDGTTTNASLDQNVPNPFSANTSIGIHLPATVSRATLYIYNMQGSQIKQIAVNERGDTSVIIEGSTLKAGIYYYSLIADGKEVDTKKMILTK